MDICLGSRCISTNTFSSFEVAYHSDSPWFSLEKKTQITEIAKTQQPRDTRAARHDMFESCWE